MTLNGVHTAASLLLFHSIDGHTRQNSKQTAAEAVSMRVWVRAPDTRQRCWPAAVQCLTHHRNLSSHMRHPPPVEHTQQTRTERTSSRHNRYTPAVNNGSHCRTTHTHPFNGPLSGTTRYQKGKTNLDFNEARDSQWQWHQLGHVQVCTLLQTDNHANTSPLSFLEAGCPSAANSVKALKAQM